MTANKTAEAEPEQMADSPANETAADETASSESVESSEPLEQPRPAEQPAASAGEPEAASSQTGEPAADRRAEETPGEQRRRVRLNPTVNQAEAKPRPSIAATELTVSDAKAAPSGVAETSPETPSSTRGAETRPPQPQERQTGSPAETEASSQGEPAAPVGSKPETAGHSEAELQTPPAEEAAVEEDVSAGQADQPAAKAASPTAPVELPPKVENLDADLEAEIAAAMAGGTLDAVAGGPQTPEAPAVEQPSEESLEAGTRLKGKVESISDDNVFLELGYRFPGVVQRRQFEAGKPPELGQILEVTVDRVDPEDGLILVNLPRGMRKVAGNWDAVATGQVVDCMVTKTNKGGLEVTVSSLRGFLPASQVDLGFVSDLEPFVGQKLRVQITEVNPKKRNLVVSRRAYLQIERQEAEEALWKTLEVGQTFTGKVKTLKDYGAFVDIGGVDGFLHVGEISWTRIRHPSDVLQEGQQVEVQVISLDAEKKKIGLGMRQLIQNPWTDVTSKYPVGSTVSGRVTRTMDFGAFVELEPGLEGLIHISELEYKRVRKVTDVLQVDQEVDVKVLETDPDRKRISLSLKALQEKPEEAKRPDEELAPEREEPPAAVSKRREPLRGGTGSQSGKGGLFGNPRDYS